MKLSLSRVTIDSGLQGRPRIDFAPGRATLVHGPNESGKSFLVDAVMSILFPRDGLPGSRTWPDLRGKVEIEAEPVGRLVFGTTGRKRRSLVEVLEQSGQALPAIIPSLFADRGHDISLQSDAKDRAPYGAERGFLGEMLAGRRLLSRLQGSIPSQLRKEGAGWRDGTPSFDRTGRTGDWYRMEERLNEVVGTLDRLAADPGILRLGSRERMLEACRQRLADFEHARKAAAWAHYQEMQNRQAELDEMPDETLVTDGLHDLDQLAATEREISALETRRQSLLPIREQEGWVSSALTQWDEAVATFRPPSVIVTIVALLPIAAAAAAALAGYGTMAGSLAAFGLLTSFAALYTLRKHARISQNLREIEWIKLGWRERYGTPLRGKADLIELQGRLRSSLTEFSAVEIALREKRSAVNGLRTRLERFGDDPEDGYPEWRARLEGLRSARNSLESEILRRQNAISMLGGVSGPVTQPPDAPEYDAEAHRVAREELAGMEREVDALRREALEISMKAGILEETAQDPSAERLLLALETRRDEALDALRTSSAEILAQLALRDAVSQMISSETDLLQKALESDAMTGPLRSLTMGYSGWEIDEGGRLHVISPDGGKLGLDRLSTGTAEQALLALRIGLLRHFGMLEGAFLLLDDSIQHSDSSRREATIDLLSRIVEDGWQILFLTMDEGLAALFRRRFSPLGDDFVEVAL